MYRRKKESPNQNLENNKLVLVDWASKKSSEPWWETGDGGDEMWKIKPGARVGRAEEDKYNTQQTKGKPLKKRSHDDKNSGLREDTERGRQDKAKRARPGERRQGYIGKMDQARWTHMTMTPFNQRFDNT